MWTCLSTWQISACDIFVIVRCECGAHSGATHLFVCFIFSCCPPLIVSFPFFSVSHTRVHTQLAIFSFSHHWHLQRKFHALKNKLCVTTNEFTSCYCAVYHWSVYCWLMVCRLVIRIGEKKKTACDHSLHIVCSKVSRTHFDSTENWGKNYPKIVNK